MKKVSCMRYYLAVKVLIKITFKSPVLTHFLQVHYKSEPHAELLKKL